jgi:hypothetical protein
VAEGLGSGRWHSDAIPPVTERESVLDAIALEVSGAAFDLMGVLAIFPELRPDLTLYAANRLRGPDGAPLVDEAGICALAALPWFRSGRMPDWLRLELGRTVPRDRAEEARAMFAEWLTPSASPGRLGSLVEITVDTLGDVAANSASRADSRQVGDAIFLRFCNRESLTELDLEAPKTLVDRIKQRLVWRPSRSLVVAGLSSAAALLLIIVSSSLLSERVKILSPPNWVFLSCMGLIIIGGSVIPFLNYGITRYRSVATFGLTPLVSFILSIIIIPIVLESTGDLSFYLLLAIPSLIFSQYPIKINDTVTKIALSNRINLLFFGILLSLIGLYITIENIGFVSGGTSKVFISPLICATGVAFICLSENRARISKVVALSIVGAAVGVQIYLVLFVIFSSIFSHGPIKNFEFLVGVSMCTCHFGWCIALDSKGSLELIPNMIVFSLLSLIICFVGLFLEFSGDNIPEFVIIISNFTFPLISLVLGSLCITRPDAKRKTEVWIVAVIVAAFGAATWLTIWSLFGFDLPMQHPRDATTGLVLSTLAGPIAGYALVPGGIGYLRVRLFGVDRRQALMAGLAAYRPRWPLAPIPVGWLGARWRELSVLTMSPRSRKGFVSPDHSSAETSPAPADVGEPNKMSAKDEKPASESAKSDSPSFADDSYIRESASERSRPLGGLDIFLDYHTSDDDFAALVAQALRSGLARPRIPVAGSDAESRRFNNSLLSQCDAVALCWGNAPEVWVRAEAERLVNWKDLARKEDFSGRFLIVGLPKKRKGPDELRLLFGTGAFDQIMDVTENERNPKELAAMLADMTK